MKIRPNILLLQIFTMFVSCLYPEISSALSIQQSLEMLKGKLESLSGRLKELSKGLGALRYDLDTEEQASDVIQQIEERGSIKAMLEGGDNGAKSQEEKAIIIKRLFYKNKEGQTGIQNLINKNQEEDLNKVYLLLNYIPKSQQVALMDSAVKDLDFSKMQEEQKEKFFIEVVVRGGLTESFNKWKEKLGDEKVKTLLSTQRNNIKIIGDLKVACKGSPLHVLRTDNQDYMRALINFYRNDIKALEAILTNKKLGNSKSVIETFLRSSHIGMIKCLLAHDKLKEAVDTEINRLFGPNKNEAINNFVKNAEDKGELLLFFFDTYRDLISFIQAIKIYDSLILNLEVKEVTFSQIKNLMSEKLDDLPLDKRKKEIEYYLNQKKNYAMWSSRGYVEIFIFLQKKYENIIDKDKIVIFFNNFFKRIVLLQEINNKFKKVIQELSSVPLFKEVAKEVLSQHLSSFASEDVKEYIQNQFSN